MRPLSWFGSRDMHPREGKSQGLEGARAEGWARIVQRISKPSFRSLGRARQLLVPTYTEEKIGGFTFSNITPQTAKRISRP